MNTPRSISDQSGSEVWRWDNTEPFGDSVPNDDPSELGPFDMPLRFAGQYSDRESSRFYNFFRDYDPATGTYKQSDLVGLRGGPNTYLYVGANPLSRYDSYGLWCVPQYVADAISGDSGGFVGGLVASGGNLGVAALSGTLGAAAGYAFSDSGPVGGTIAGASGGLSALAKGGGGFAGFVGGVIGGAVTGGLAAGASDPETQNTSGGIVGGAVGGFISGILTNRVGNNFNPITMGGLGILGGFAGGLTQDVVNQLLKPYICNECKNK